MKKDMLQELVNEEYQRQPGPDTNLDYGILGSPQLPDYIHRITESKPLFYSPKILENWNNLSPRGKEIVLGGVELFRNEKQPQLWSKFEILVNHMFQLELPD